MRVHSNINSEEEEEYKQLHTVAKTAEMHQNEWIENANRWVAEFLEKFEEQCDIMETAIKDRIEEKLRRQSPKALNDQIPHQHHHQNSSYDQIPHQQQQQHHRNRFYDQIKALQHCAASSDPTRLKVKPKAKALVVVDYPVDVLMLLLARLPAKALLKFRCVCKSWNSLIQQDHHFISLHHQLHLNDNKKQSPPLVTSRPAEGEGFNIILNYSSSDSTPYEFEFKDRPYFITNSCNGLVGVYSCNSFFIVNPAIRKVRPLPIIHSFNPLYGRPQAALGFDASTGVYKVVRIFNREYDGLTPVEFGCEVCYLGSGSDGWKTIDDPPVQPYYDSLPVVVDGAIIWVSETGWEKDREVIALSLDLREEKFSVILHPEVSSRPTICPRSHVFASEGRICVADEIPPPVRIPYMHIQHLNIWLLVEKDDKKNNSNKWVKQYVVDLTHQFEQIGPFRMAQPLATDHNGRIVISWGGGRKHYYDPRTESFVKHELDATNEEHAAPYIESMVWPNSDLAVDFDRFGFDSNVYCLGLWSQPIPESLVALAESNFDCP